MPVPVASSQIILPMLTKLLVAPSSNIKLSSASVPELSVPSIEIDPSITDTNPVAAFVEVPVSVAVNVSASPTL